MLFRSVDETANPSAVADTKLTYINSNQPSAPEVTATLGGDYSIDLSIANRAIYDGFVATVYELENGTWVETMFQDLYMENDGTGVLTVGGQYSFTGTEDAVGEMMGLVEGKQYRVGVQGYKTLESGAELRSAQTRTGTLPQRGSKRMIEILAHVFQYMTDKQMKMPSFSVTSTLPSVMNGGKDFL